MDILFSHQQEKYERNKPLRNTCTLKLASDDDFLFYSAEFYIQYLRLGRLNHLSYEHGITINKKTGDFNVIYRALNKKENSHVLHRNTIRAKKNNFDMLIELTQRGFYSGEKRYNFWGVKYRRACNDIFSLIIKDLRIEHDKIGQIDKYSVNPLYDLLVDYHLNKKNIKAHDCVYWDICELYPKKKWLKLNENKFIPAVLDQLGIKSRYLIGALSTRREKTQKINIKSVKFLCTLFGENYVDYIKQFDWEQMCCEYVKSKKTFVCENESEKKALVRCFKNYSELETIAHDGILTVIQDLFLLRESLREYNLNLKIKASNTHQLIGLKETWELHKKHFKLGYKLRYVLPQEMVEDLEQPIQIGENIFKPTLILSEDQFKLEGIIMKNCMAKQFSVASIYIHAAMSLGKKRINIQYRRGCLNQNRGKANTDMPKEFNEAVSIFTQKMTKYEDILPHKEKYDIITPSLSTS